MIRPFLLGAACFVAIASQAKDGSTAVQINLNASPTGRVIPKGFAGFSREWGRFAFPENGNAGEVHPTYLKLLSHLCAFSDEPLCIRMGGASADGIREAPDKDRWSQLAQIYQTTHPAHHHGQPCVRQCQACAGLGACRAGCDAQRLHRRL